MALLGGGALLAGNAVLSKAMFQGAHTTRRARRAPEGRERLQRTHEGVGYDLDVARGAHVRVFETEVGATPVNQKRLLFYFHGNATTLGEGCAAYVQALQQHFGGEAVLHIVTFDYRGYGMSTGWPTPRNIVTDAVRVIDHVLRKHKWGPQMKFDIHGRSLGGYVAVRVLESHLISGRVERMTLETPFLGTRAVRHLVNLPDLVKPAKWHGVQRHTPVELHLYLAENDELIANEQVVKRLFPKGWWSSDQTWLPKPGTVRVARMPQGTRVYVRHVAGATHNGAFFNLEELRARQQRPRGARGDGADEAAHDDDDDDTRPPPSQVAMSSL